MRKGPTSHLPLHDDDNDNDDDTIEIPPTEILDRIFNPAKDKNPAKYFFWSPATFAFGLDSKIKIMSRISVGGISVVSVVVVVQW